MALLMAFIVCSLEDPLLAYGEQIGSALDNLIDWSTRIIGGALVVLGLVVTGIKMAAHDEHALQKGIWVIVGGLIIFLARNILGIIKGVSGFSQ